MLSKSKSKHYFGWYTLFGSISQQSTVPLSAHSNVGATVSVRSPTEKMDLPESSKLS